MGKRSFSSPLFFLVFIGSLILIFMGVVTYFSFFSLRTTCTPLYISLHNNSHRLLLAVHIYVDTFNLTLYYNETPRHPKKDILPISFLSIGENISCCYRPPMVSGETYQTNFNDCGRADVYRVGIVLIVVGGVVAVMMGCVKLLRSNWETLKRRGRDVERWRVRRMERIANERRWECKVRLYEFLKSRVGVDAVVVVYGFLKEKEEGEIYKWSFCTESGVPMEMGCFGIIELESGEDRDALICIDGKRYGYQEIKVGFYVDEEGKKRYLKGGVAIGRHWVGLGSLVKIHEEFGTIGLEDRGLEWVGYFCRDERREFDKIIRKIMKVGYKQFTQTNVLPINSPLVNLYKLGL